MPLTASSSRNPLNRPTLRAVVMLLTKQVRQSLIEHLFSEKVFSLALPTAERLRHYNKVQLMYELIVPASWTLQNMGVRTLTPDEVRALTPAASSALKNAGVREMVVEGVLKVDDLLKLSVSASMALRNAEVRKMVAAGALKLDQVLKLCNLASWALRNAEVREMVAAGALETIDRGLVVFPYAARMALRVADVRALIRDGKLNIDQVLELSVGASLALLDANVRALIRDNKLEIRKMVKLSIGASDALRNAHVRELINLGLLEIDVVLTSCRGVSLVLQDPGVYALIHNGMLKTDQLPDRLSDAAIRTLLDPNVQELMRAGVLEIDQALRLGDTARAILSDPKVRTLVRTRALTIDKVVEIKNAVLAAPGAAAAIRPVLLAMRNAFASEINADNSTPRLPDVEAQSAHATTRVPSVLFAPPGAGPSAAAEDSNDLLSSQHSGPTGSQRLPFS